MNPHRPNPPALAALVPLFAAWIAGTALASASGPIALHPENPHYFLWRDKPAILVTSGEHYGAVLNLDFDHVRYLDTLAADGLNHTRIFSGTYREIPGAFKITGNTLAPASERFLCPWARSDQPGSALHGNRFDLSKFNPAYFQRLQQFLEVADRRGVVVEINLFCPSYNDQLWAVSPMNAANNVNGVGDCPWKEVLTLKHPQLLEFQTAFVRKIATEVNRFDNFYFEICNEPYFGADDDWQRHIAGTIVAAERDLPAKHLISWNVANGRKKVADPHPAISIFNFHYCVPPDTVPLNYALNRVIGENETGFRGRHDVLYRTEGWDFLLAGGALYNNLDYSFTPEHPDGTFRGYTSPGGGSPELRKQLGILKRFVETFDFLHMKPDRSVLRSVGGGLSARALVQPGRAYAVYLHVPIPEKPKDFDPRPRGIGPTPLELELPAGTYRLEWVDPLTGNVSLARSMDHAGGPARLNTPEFQDDVALRIVAAGAAATPP